MFCTKLHNAIYINGGSSKLKESHRGVMARMLDCGFEESEFNLQSRYRVHFQTNTLEKPMNFPYPPAMN